MTADGTLVYPAGGQGSQGAGEQRSKGAEEQGCTVQPTPYLTLVYGQIEVNGSPAPAGTRVEAVTPGGEVAGCFAVQAAGYFGVMPVYGADADGITPGFREGEAIAWRVNGQEATGPELTWANNKEVHQVRLEVSRAGSRAYLPVIVK
jgi:hypothetical protein